MTIPERLMAVEVAAAEEDAGGGHFNVFADVAVRVAALAGSINQAEDPRNTTTDEPTGRSDRAESRPNKAGERES